MRSLPVSSADDDSVPHLTEYGGHLAALACECGLDTVTMRHLAVDAQEGERQDRQIDYPSEGDKDHRQMPPRVAAAIRFARSSYSTPRISRVARSDFVHDPLVTIGSNATHGRLQPLTGVNLGLLAKVGELFPNKTVQPGKSGLLTWIVADQVGQRGELTFQ